MLALITSLIMENIEEKQKTLGQKRVRTAFNPSSTSIVDSIKSKAAELIDEINKMPKPENLKDEDLGEFIRCKSVSMTEIESAAHWAVKAATF